MQLDPFGNTVFSWWEEQKYDDRMVGFFFRNPPPASLPVADEEILAGLIYIDLISKRILAKKIPGPRYEIYASAFVVLVGVLAAWFLMTAPTFRVEPELIAAAVVAVANGLFFFGIWVTVFVHGGAFVRLRFGFNPQGRIWVVIMLALGLMGLPLVGTLIHLSASGMLPAESGVRSLLGAGLNVVWMLLAYSFVYWLIVSRMLVLLRRLREST